MLQYFIALLLISSYYQSLGNPVPEDALISHSLADLVQECKNVFLTNAITSQIKDCEIPVPHSQLYSTKQIRCLIYLDINKQLCSAVAASKLTLSNDYKIIIGEKEDVNTVCTLAKNWVFTNLTDYNGYKNSSEHVFKSLALCGETCGVEDVMNDVNYFCKYFKWGTEILTAQTLSTENNMNKNSVDDPVIPEPESNPKADIPVSVNNNPISPHISSTNTVNVESKEPKLAVPKSPLENSNEAADLAVSKSTAQTSPKQPLTHGSESPVGKKVDVDADVVKSAIDVPEVGTGEQANKPTVNLQPKHDTQSDPQLPSKDLINVDQKDAVLENNDDKASNDPDDYAGPEGADDTDDDDEDPNLNANLLPEKQESFSKSKMPSQSGDISQKDFYPNTDGFSEDGDHFFPFFLTAIILVILLYVLYHNKNKVGKVFFGLILEGRQSSRRRNSRGHAYRRLDTLEQAMSANTAAPPSKIIY